MDNGCDWREGVMEYKNAPIIHLNASPAQILQSRNLRSQIPMSSNNLEPKIQLHIYDQLCKQKEITKLNYDKLTRKTPVEYKKGDKVVIKTNKEKC